MCDWSQGTHKSMHSIWSLNGCDTYPPLLLHITLTYIYIRFWFLTYYPKLCLNWLFEALNKFKWKSCQLQSFITFRDLQLSFCSFSVQGRLQNLNFKFKKFKRSFPWQDDFKWKSYQLQSFITFWDLQLSFLLFVHLRPFKNSNFKFLKIQT
jgi:hypothetical protein